MVASSASSLDSRSDSTKESVSRPERRASSIAIASSQSRSSRSSLLAISCPSQRIAQPADRSEPGLAHRLLGAAQCGGDLVKGLFFAFTTQNDLADIVGQLGNRLFERG